MQTCDPQLKREKILLIMQALQNLGYDQSFDMLQKEAGITFEPQIITQLREALKSMNFHQAQEIINFISIDPQTKNKMLLLVLEQHYLYLLIKNQTQLAVNVLRSEIQPICDDNEKIHQLAACIMVQPIENETYNKQLELKTPDKIVDEILFCCHKQLSILQPRRLEQLMIQAKCHQVMQCEWYAGLKNNFLVSQPVTPGKQINISNIVNVPIHSEEILFTTFSPNGKFFASVCKKPQLCIFEFAQIENNGQARRQGKLHKIFEQIAFHQHPISVLKFSPCSCFLASGSYDQSVKIIILRPEVKVIYTLKGHSSMISGISWRYFDGLLNNPKKTKYFSIFSKKTFEVEINDIWEIYTGSQDGWINIWKDGQKKGGFKVDPLSNMIIYQDKLLLEHSKLKKISIYDVYKKIEIKSLFEQDEIINTTINNDFTLILVNVSFKEPKLNLYSSDKFQLIRTFQGFKQQKISLRPCFGWIEQNLIAIGSEDGNVFIWHKNNERKILIKKKLSDGSINTICFHPEIPDLFVMGCEDRLLRVCYPEEFKFQIDEPLRQLQPSDRASEFRRCIFNFISLSRSQSGDQSNHERVMQEEEDEMEEDQDDEQSFDSST